MMLLTGVEIDQIIDDTRDYFYRMAFLRNCIVRGHITIHDRDTNFEPKHSKIIERERGGKICLD